MVKDDRRCVSCRKVAPKATFWRVIRLAGSQTVVLDQGMGRSAYLCPCDACLKAAQKKDRLSRALKAPISGELYDRLAQRLTASTDLPEEM
jgi:uncharacterized protein